MSGLEQAIVWCVVVVVPCFTFWLVLRPTK